MRALFAFGGDVPVSRVIADHRRWLWPVGVVLAINVIVLIAVVLPLRQSVQSGSVTADASAQALREAMADLKEAEATLAEAGASKRGSLARPTSVGVCAFAGTPSRIA